MAVDYFLKINGIEGESQDKGHPKEIQVATWSWGETQEGSHSAGGGGGAGKVAMQDFHFTMHANKASPALFLACANGEHIKDATLCCRKAGKDQQEYLKIFFEDMLISSYQIGGNSNDTIPVEQISFNFAKIKIDYKPQKADGMLGSSVVQSWNLKTNAAAW